MVAQLHQQERMVPMNFVQPEQRRHFNRNKRLRELNELIDEAVKGDYRRVATVGDLANLMQERNAIVLQMEAESNRKNGTATEKETAAYMSQYAYNV